MNNTWDLKYVSWGVDSTSADAISRWRRIWRKEGLFLGLQFLQIQDGKTQLCTFTMHCKINKILKPQTYSSQCNYFQPLPLLLSSAHLSSPPRCAHFFFFLFQLPICRRCSPALSEEDLEAIWAALRYGQLKAVVSHTPDDCRWVDIFIRDLSCKHLPEHHSKRPLRDVTLYLFRKSHWGQNIFPIRDWRRIHA